MFGGRALMNAMGISALVLLLVGGAGAAPFAYITNRNSNTVSVIDTATNTVTATVNVGSYPIGVAVNPAGTLVYVANSESHTVSVLSANSVVNQLCSESFFQNKLKKFLISPPIAPVSGKYASIFLNTHTDSHTASTTAAQAL